MKIQEAWTQIVVRKSSNTGGSAIPSLTHPLDYTLQLTAGSAPVNTHPIALITETNVTGGGKGVAVLLRIHDPKLKNIHYSMYFVG